MLFQFAVCEGAALRNTNGSSALNYSHQSWKDAGRMDRRFSALAEARLDKNRGYCGEQALTVQGEHRQW